MDLDLTFEADSDGSFVSVWRNSYRNWRLYMAGK